MTTYTLAGKILIWLHTKYGGIILSPHLLLITRTVNTQLGILLLKAKIMGHILPDKMQRRAAFTLSVK